MTHSYARHGTTTLFAALDISNGEVMTTCKQRHRHQEFLSFLKLIDKSVPAELDIHIIELIQKLSIKYQLEKEYRYPDAALTKFSLKM